MTPLTNQLDLDAIQARLDAATEGPWTVSPDYSDVLGPDGDHLASYFKTADGELIAHAREDVDALVAEVRRLRAELAAEQDQHATTLRQRNNRSARLLQLRALANAGDTDALVAAALDTLAASRHDHTPDEAGEPMSEPSACRWCGIPQREHAQRWAKPVGWHKWEQPTQEQVKARMLGRRAVRSSGEAQQADIEAPQPTSAGPASTALRIRVLREVLARIDGSGGDGDSAIEEVGAATVRAVLAEILADMHPAARSAAV